MTDIALSLSAAALDTPAPSRPPRTSWPPLMGDIVSHRAGVPELLIQWARARGEPDPLPEP